MGNLGGVDMMRQVTMILALAICLALAVFVMLWAQEPEYRPLGKMETQEMVQVLDVLDKNKVKYQIDVDVIKVPEDKYQEVKMMLSRAGIDSPAANQDFLNKDSGFVSANAWNKLVLSIAKKKTSPVRLSNYKVSAVPKSFLRYLKKTSSPAMPLNRVQLW